MKKRHIVVLSVSAGAGHVRAAQALCAQASQSHPQLKVTHIDVMELVPSTFRKLYAQSYIGLVEKAPLLWAYLYQRTDASIGSSGDELRRAIERMNTRGLERELEQLQPDAIVCTHFLPAELLSRRIRKGRPTPPVWVQVTDFDVHGLWLHAFMDGYFVANEEVAERLTAKGISREQVHVTGIPIMPAFNKSPARKIAAGEHGLDPDKMTLLMMSGGAGVGDIAALAEQLASLPEDLQIVALAGKNKTLLESLRVVAARFPGRVFPMGFTATIERVMAAADVAISKPGGLTSTECLAMNLPMIVVSPIPGQEERNADYLLESGVALKAVDVAALQYKVRMLFNDRKRLAQMKSRMQQIARPDAAQSVLTLVESGLGQKSAAIKGR
jgi:processive 1,2-diacylglycerol beta-glucosyltransferase